MIRLNSIVHSDVVRFLEEIDDGECCLIYLDPPWLNSAGFESNQFAEDDCNDRSDEKRLSEYLAWLSRVLQQARRICSERGSVVLYVTPRLGSYARVMAERLFSPSLVTEIVIPLKRRGPAASPFDEHETLLVCRKSNRATLNPIYRPLAAGELLKRFPMSDEKGRYRLSDLSGPNGLRNTFPIFGVFPPPGRSWRISQEQAEHLIRENRIVFPEGTHYPRVKQYEAEFPGEPIGTIWDDISFGVPAAERTGLKGQQPLSLAERILELTTNPGDLIVDPFVGSGTMLDAATALDRRWLGADRDKGVINIALERLNRKYPGGDVKLVEAEALSDRPGVMHKYAALAKGLTMFEREVPQFIFGTAIDVDETRHTEFKEVKGNRPVDTIKNHADEYAVAFLNGEGGRMFWGIRDADHVTVGIKLDAPLRDSVGKAIDMQLMTIQPPVSPSYWRVFFHPVYDGRESIDELYVVELLVSPPENTRDLYATASNNVYIKTDSGKKKLSFTEVLQEVRRRDVATSPKNDLNR